LTNRDFPDARQVALDYLGQHSVMSLATHGPWGLWAAAVFYANDDFTLFFLSAGHTRHGRNIAANPWAAATIQENYRDWPEIQGLQLAGTVELLNGKEKVAAIKSYNKKYPFLSNSGQVVNAALKKVNWYRLIPQQLYFVDNTKGFGHRDEILSLTNPESNV
jgi:uncharacterized protein YhbP (UPF0306 family)